MINLLLAIIYLSFISLGLPDSLLGSAWPSMYEELNVPISYAGIISMIIAVGTIVSSLFSDKFTNKLGAGKVTAISVAMTAFALFGFSVSNSFVLLCLFAVPYGLGAGSVDAALNNFVALNYESRHMSWLHCMWGVGTTIGPIVMGYALTNAEGWNNGYLYISLFQILLSVVLFISLPLWRKTSSEKTENNDIKNQKPLSLLETVRINGAKEVMLAFFCYCAVEQTAMLWVSSYMNLHVGMSEENSASCASVFFVGITLGRFLNGFLTYKFTDTQMVRIGSSIIIIGASMLLLPLGQIISIIGVVLIGLGCAPIYPSIIHSTPERFGEDKSQTMIGVQMASAYVGTCLMPPLFGIVAKNINVSLLPVYLIILTLVMILVHEILVKKTREDRCEH